MQKAKSGKKSTKAYSRNGQGLISLGQLHDTRRLPAIASVCGGKLYGYLVYELINRKCEIIVLQSLKENEGIGSGLIARAAEIARKQNCEAIYLITTNDNAHAMRFYQRRGFTLTSTHLMAIEKARSLKPSIPYIGMNGIPINDELEFTMRL